eukprot:NODE_4092_length_1117_cov_56.273642_g3897_i0.p1 GENE.NODE_4092_length_1117_cov_56.273642_g3897_i0~~NODE_4092_length_1117_cov_56.273642_g3897_i0.p1  ORF type:complete len:300 (-),score=28.97 NODE_4092_length_1117_cov_56.273642_g3897_i0:132-1031(-)
MVRFCLAYDASGAAVVAGQFLRSLVQPRDTVVVYHAYKASKKDPKKTREREMEAQTVVLNGVADVDLVSADPGQITTCTRPTKDVREDLLEFADGQFDVLVMGTRGLGSLHRTLLGSVSTFAANHLKRTAVLILPDQKWEYYNGKRYLVFTDGSEPCQRAIKTLESFISVEDSLHLVSFYERAYVPPFPKMEPRVAQQLLQAHAAFNKEGAEAVVRDAAHYFKSLSEKAKAVTLTASVVETHDTKEGILEYAEKETASYPGCTCVVMGTRGLSGFSRLCLGSCTNFMLNHAVMPLLIVH